MRFGLRGTNQVAAPLRVVLDARIVGGGSNGGIEQVIIGLAGGLAQLHDGDEEYIFLAYSGATDWLEPYLGKNMRIHAVPRPLVQTVGPKVAGAFPQLTRFYQKLRLKSGVVGRSDGTIEALGVDVMHFTFQEGFLTSVPSLYHPHDLQHIHLPQYFSHETIEIRNRLYRTMCAQARIVCVGFSWTKRDVAENLQVPEGKIRVVPLAPSTAFYPKPTPSDIEACRKRLTLPDNGFAFYPAQTWPHKNHLVLLEALARVRDSYGAKVPLIASGKRTDFYYGSIHSRIQELGLGDQVRFVDFVTPLELQCLYRLSTLCVIPTKFEAGSFPMWEAFLAGVPVACSNVTSLPEQAAGSALIFDPDNPADLAQVIFRLWTEAALRRELIAKGTSRVAMFDWRKTARHFRAIYREVGGRAPTAEDSAILAANVTV